MIARIALCPAIKSVKQKRQEAQTAGQKSKAMLESLAREYDSNLARLGIAIPIKKQKR
jgi:hypothetical protein